MREIKAHFTCDRCKHAQAVEVDVPDPESPPNWIIIRDPANRPKHLCVPCAAGFRAFMLNVPLAPDPPGPPAKALCSCPSDNSCYQGAVPPNMICRRNLPAAALLHIPPEAT